MDKFETGDLRWMDFKIQEAIAIFPIFGAWILIFITQWLFFVNGRKMGNKSSVIFNFAIMLPFFLIIFGILMLGMGMIISSIICAVVSYILAYIIMRYQKSRINTYLKQQKPVDKCL